MSDDTTIIYDNHVDTRRNKNRFWLSKKQRDIGDSADLDKIISAWVWSNQGYGHRGLIVVDTPFGYTHGSYSGTDEGIQEMKEEQSGRKIWGTYEDGDDLHILVVGKVKRPKTEKVVSRNRAKRTKSRNKGVDSKPQHGRNRLEDDHYRQGRADMGAGRRRR